MPESPDAQGVYKSNSESLVNAAKALYDLGFNVIPVGEGKQPVKGFKWADPIDTGRRLGFDELARWFGEATAVAVSGGFLEGNDGVDYVPIIFDVDDTKEGAKILSQVFGDDWPKRLCGQSWSFCGLTGPRPKHRVLCDCKAPGDDCECLIFDRDVEGLGIEEAVKQGAKEVDRKHLSELERGMYIIARVPKACAPGAGVVKLGGGAIEVRFRGYELVYGRHPSGAFYEPVRWVDDAFRPIGISEAGTGEPITCNEWAKLTSLFKQTEPEVKPEVKGEAAAVQLPEAKRHLKPEKLKQLVELLKPLWPLRKSGGEHVHDLLLYGVVSAMRYRGIRYENARKFVEEMGKYGISIGEDSEKTLQEHLRATVDYIYKDPDAKPWGFKAFKENFTKYGGVSALVNGGVIKGAEEFDAWFEGFKKAIRKILGFAAKEVTLDPGLMEARGRGELPRPERKLSEDGKRTLEELLLKMWGLKMKGRFMHNVIAYGTASLLRRAGIAYGDARAVIEDVVKLAVEEGIDTEGDADKHLDYVEHVYNNPIAHIWSVRTFVEAGESIIRRLYATELQRRVGDVDGDEKAAKKRIREMERELGKEMQADIERWRGRVVKFIGGALAAIHGLKPNVGISLAESALARKQLAKVVMAMVDAAIERFPYLKNFTMPGAGGGEVDLGLFCWDGKHYTECEDKVESYVEYMYEAVGLEDTELKYSSIVKETVEVLKNKVRAPVWYEHLVIAFDNCMFDWKTLKCEEHNPEKLVYHYIPHPIDVDLLSEALAKDELTEGFVKTHIPKTLEAFKQWAGDKWIKLLEIVGYVLYPNPEKSKAFLFIDADIRGQGDTGKSTYINLLKLMLGSENYSAVSLQKLTDSEKPYQAADIYRKLANLYPDLPEEAIKDPGAFKVLTGGDTLTLEKKYGHPFKWMPYTKFIFSANKPPPIPDEKIDEAWLKRWDIVEFIGSFKEKIESFHLTLKDEIPKLIALGIAAFNNVRRRGYFTYQYSPEEVYVAWMSRYDTVFAFVNWARGNNMLVREPTARVRVSELYPYYVRYCIRNEKNPVPQRTFTMRLKNLGFVITRAKNVSTIVGYRLDTEQAEKLLPHSEAEEEGDWLTGEDQAEENEEKGQGEATN